MTFLSQALLEVSRDHGFVYLGESADGEINVRTDNSGAVRKYTKLEELEFDSFRKCMTVVVR